jgi:hypothetical protein
MPIGLEKLQEWLRYDPLTGLFHWVKKPNRNTRIGDRAGWVHKDSKSEGLAYIYLQCEKQIMLGHHAAFLLVTGRCPNSEVDHQNGIGTDNRWENLREVTHAANGRNQRLNSANTSGTMGVDFHAASGRWRARIIYNQHEKHLGLFSTRDEATAARKAAEQQFGFHQNHGRTYVE